MNGYSYSVGELKALIAESSQEFKAVLGPNVERDNKKNNSESYKESKKRAEDFDGGLNEPKKNKLGKKIDGNKTTLDYNPSNEPDKKYKDRVNAQAKGYTSDLEEKNGNKRGGAEFDDEGRILKQFNDARDNAENIKKDLQKGGLVGRTLPDEVFDKNHLNEDAPKPKRLKFKHTKFVNENQMLSRIPEEYKIDKQIIHMIDAADNEYIVECTLSQRSGMIETNIVNHRNKKVMNEQVNRMFALMDYNTPKGMTVQDKINESKGFKEFMDFAREKDQ